MESRTVYFKNPGKENTDEALLIVKRRAAELDIKKIVVASTTGFTALKAVDILEDFKLIIVTHSSGFKQPNTQEFTEESRRIVESKGAIVLTCTHAFGGINRAMRQGSITQAPATYTVGDVVASTLSIFGKGVKVACEIASMAADAGLVRTDERIISVAGTGSGGAGRGADVALVLHPAYAQFFFEAHVNEILCKPYLD